MAMKKNNRGLLIATVAAVLGAGMFHSGVTLAAFNPFNPSREGDTVGTPQPTPTPTNPTRPPTRDPFRPPIRSPFTP
jgi:hypothetical protein